MKTPTALVVLFSTRQGCLTLSRWKKVVSPVCLFSSGPVRNSYVNSFSRSNQQYAPFSVSSTNNNPLGVEITSVEHIKPAFPTPQHLRTYEVSMLDQQWPNIYMSFVYMYSNEDQNGSDLDLISKRRQLLKQSLSETLTRFYPLAGKLQGDSIIYCNDEGVYYAEARVNESLTNFVNQPNNKSAMHQLLPFVPTSVELISKTYVIMIQATTFECGGISIGLYTSHKIIDGYSHVTFLNAWASTCRGSSQDMIICPSFISTSIFPPSPTLDLKAASKILNCYPKQGKVVTKRFVFSASSLMALKKEAAAPTTRVVAVTGLIWKCIMAASRSRSSSSVNCDSVLVFLMNLRERCLPHFPPYSIGNIIWSTCIRCKGDHETDLRSIVGLIKNTADKVNSEFTEKLKGEQGMVEYLNEMKLICSGQDVEQVGVTSLCNSGIYEAADFGWGKPCFISVGDSNADISLFPSFVYLMDTRSGNGIEAWVTLREQDMHVSRFSYVFFKLIQGFVF